jgi:uncharacterized protein YggE
MYRTCGVLVIVAFLIAGPAFAIYCRAAPPALITVTGEAEVRVSADEVIISLGVETSDRKIESAKRKSDEIVKRLMAALEKSGVPANYITTDFMHIEPGYRHDYFQKVFLGFFVRKTVVVTVKEIPLFDKVLSAAITSGADYVHGIRFRTTELRKHRDRARRLALEAAKEKARDMAAVLDLKIGKPHSIKETPTWWVSSYRSHWGGRSNPASRNVVQSALAPSRSGEGALPPGQIAVRAKVTVSFELEKAAAVTP